MKATYGYDANGNQTSGTDTDRLTGQLVRFSATYTAANQETDRTTTPDAGLSLDAPAKTVVTNTFDHSDTTTVTAKNTFDCSSRLLTQTTDLVYGPQGADHQVATTSAGTTSSWLYLDRQRTVRATAGADGVTTSASSYTDFGVFELAAGTLYAGAGTEAAPGQEDKLTAIHLPVATTRTPVGYTGEQANPVAGLQHYYARDYQPGLASWIQGDKWAGNLAQPRTLNKYAFVLDNPATLVDVLGNRPCAYEYNYGCHDTPLVIAVNDNCSPMNGCAVDRGWDSGPGSGEPIEYGPQDGGPSYGPTPQTDPSNPGSDNGQYSGNPICNPRFITSGTCQVTGISLDPNSWLLGLGIAVGVVAAAAIVACVLATTGFCAAVGVGAGAAAADGTAAGIGVAGETAVTASGGEAVAIVAEPTVADLNALVPTGPTLGSWGNQIWGTGMSGAAELIGARTASELSQIPGLTVESATTLRNFYRLAVEAGKGGAAAPVRVELLNNIIKVLGGTP